MSLEQELEMIVHHLTVNGHSLSDETFDELCARMKEIVRGDHESR
jgi:hypothetical protein